MSRADELELEDRDLAIYQAKNIIHELEERINEMQATFDLRYAADMRGIELWRIGRPDRDLKMPDHADLILWLMAYIEGQDKIAIDLIADKNSIIDRLEEQNDEPNS